MTASRYGGTFDASLQLKDAYLVAASALAKVGGANKVIDVGDSVFFGVVEVDVSAIETGTGDELYTLCLQGGLRDTTSTRAVPVIAANTVEELVALPLGAAAARPGSSLITSGIGRYRMFFQNRQAAIVYPILQLYIKVAGTIATGINCTATIKKSGF